jgi:hypothetical protein
MAEAVRFYWQRGEAALPLRAISERGREPLQIPRSIAQQYVPEVVDQLEDGRFVAAAWPSGKQISMVLCHPNVAKGSGDAFLLDTKSPPWVVLRMQDWGAATQVARLFLAAFGSEAVDAEECLAARKGLVGWLEKHDQPEMAAIVRRFFKFPLGFRSDALEVINTWRNLLVKGAKEQIDRFLPEVGSRFERLGWSRDQKFEDLLNRTSHPINHFYCWVSSEGTFPQVMLCLNRTTDRRVRGGTYDILEGGPSFIDLAIEIQHVLTEVLEPAAAEVGLEVSYQRLGPISRVEPRTTTAMTAFAEAAEGRWPLTPALEPLWTAFVRTAVQNDVAINPNELIAWFVANGWTTNDAKEMGDRFYTDAARMREYEDTGKQPA